MNKKIKFAVVGIVGFSIIFTSVIGVWFITSPARFALEPDGEPGNWDYIPIDDSTLEKFPYIKQAMDQSKRVSTSYFDEEGIEVTLYPPIMNPVDIPNSVAWEMFDELGVEKRFPFLWVGDPFGAKTYFHLQYKDEFYYALIQFCLDPCGEFA